MLGIYIASRLFPSITVSSIESIFWAGIRPLLLLYFPAYHHRHFGFIYPGN
jgi:hypothetical protein